MRLRSRERRERSRDEEEEEEEEVEVKFAESEMIPKSGKSPADSRKSVGIHEFAALARSSLNGISQAVRDHVTKPTSLAQGRVAHLIEWKGWPKPAGPSPAAHSQFNSYCHLTEGEKEARFAAGVAEQFAIAEAKLRAWASIDDDEEEDFTDEDAHVVNGQTQTLSAQRSDAAMFDPSTETPRQPEAGGVEATAASASSSSDGLSCHPRSSQTSSPFLEEEEEEEEEEEKVEGCEEACVPLPRGDVCVHNKPEWRPRRRSSRFDSCYSTSHSESPGEEEDEEEEEEEGEEGSVFQEVRVWHCSPRSFFSERDRASSGVASFDEEDEEGEEGQVEEKKEEEKEEKKEGEKEEEKKEEKKKEEKEYFM